MLRASSRCLSGLRVLIVDDDFDFRQALISVVAMHGAAASCVASAAAARAELARERFDLVVSDINMPGEDGYVFIARLRASPDPRLRRLRAMAMSAVDDAAARRRALAAGFDIFMPKLSHLKAFVRSLQLLAQRNDQF